MSERGGRKPPTLSEFDYFGDVPAELAEAPSPHDPHDDHHEASHHGARWRALGTAFTTSIFLAVAVWFMAGYADAARYAFQDPHEPLVLGDVSEMTPDQIPHNTYVTVRGVTEHRGLRQQMVRGLSLSRNDYWYFRLLGSRGVFVEVEPDAKRYGFTTEITATGRAVDPSLAPVYEDLLRSYGEMFAAENRPVSRIIQVGVAPGEDRSRYVGALGILGTLGLLNILALVRLLRNLLGSSSSSASR